MRTEEAQGLLRELITEADHLSRVSYKATHGERSWRFAALRTTLQRLERHVGQDFPRFTVVGEFDVLYQRIVDMASAGGPEEADDLDRMCAAAGRLRTQVLRTTPSRNPTPKLTARGKWAPWALPLALVAFATVLVLLATRRI
jgi:hypothetical protein